MKYDDTQHYPKGFRSFPPQVLSCFISSNKPDERFSKCTTLLLINDQLRLTWLQVYKKSLKVWPVKMLPLPFLCLPHRGCSQTIKHPWNSDLVSESHHHKNISTLLLYCQPNMGPSFSKAQAPFRQELMLTAVNCLCYCGQRGGGMYRGEEKASLQLFLIFHPHIWHSLKHSCIDNNRHVHARRSSFSLRPAGRGESSSVILHDFTTVELLSIHLDTSRYISIMAQM